MGFQESCVGVGIALNIGDIDKSSTQSAGPSLLNQKVDFFNHPATFGIRESVVSTPTTAVNFISIQASAVMGGRGGSQTWTQKITEGGVIVGSEITSTFNTISTNLILLIQEQDNNVPAGATTYDLETKSSSANQVGLICSSIGTVVAQG